MTKASTIRAKRGQTTQRRRTRPTTGNLGAREAGPHGLTLNQRQHWRPTTPALSPNSWRRLLFGRKS